MDHDQLIIRRKFGEWLIKEAGKFALFRQSDKDSLRVNMKGVQDWLTDADQETEQFIRAKISSKFPTDQILGEESGGEVGGTTWIVDPIDGTVNFAHESPFWCVSIAFVSNGQAQLGFICAPVLGEVFVAQRGSGASMNGLPIDCARDVPADRSVIELSWLRGEGFRAYKDQVEILLDQGYEFYRGGAGALSLAWIGLKRLEGYAEVDMNAWDGMAGWLIAREAGASVNDYDQVSCASGKGDIAVGATAQIRTDLELAIYAAGQNLRLNGQG